MPGDYSRISDQPHKRFSALFMQQGRVQLDADWNESVEILRRRIREEANDIFGPVAVPRATTPNGFQIGWTGTAAAGDITISPGRLYVDGLLAECFPDETVTYTKQPFYLNPPAISKYAGNVLVYLDVWEREITAIEDGSIIDPALNGTDTGTRLQTVWQVKLAQASSGGSAGCVSDFSMMFAPSGARLSNQTIPAAQAPNPCQLAAAGGYQGIDNRCYRVQVHDPANRLLKWSRDNGSIATQVTTIANGSVTTLTVASVGRDDDLSFHVNDWVEVNDEGSEQAGQVGVMAMVTQVDASLRQLTLDRSLAGAGFDTTKSVRVRRWDQTQGLYTTGGQSSGLVQYAVGTWLTLENGIQVKIDLTSGGAALAGDTWIFAARVATGSVDPLTSAPPIAIRHHYASLGTLSGVGGSTVPSPTDCRVLWPPVGSGGDCACTVCVDAADHNSGKATLQQAVNQVIAAGGGVVCLGPGTFNLAAIVNVASASGVAIRGMGEATVLASTAATAINVTGAQNVQITDLVISCAPSVQTAPQGFAVGVAISGASVFVTVERTWIQVNPGTNSDKRGARGVGIGVTGSTAYLDVRRNVIVATIGFLGQGVTEDDTATKTSDLLNVARIVATGLRLEENLIHGTLAGISIRGQVAASAVSIAGNRIWGQVGILFGGAVTTPLSIAANYIVGADGIFLGCADFEVFDNVVLGTGTPGGSGIDVEDAPTEQQVRGAIERNRISGFVGGVGITVDADASRLTIRDNTITRADSGIVMSDTATADDLVIEGNEVSDIGASSTGTTLENGFAGIVVIGATRALVRNNTLNNIGSADTSGAGILGIGVSQPAVASIVENEIRAIGSSSTTSALTYGIQVTGPFNDVRVAGNRVEVAQVSATSTSALAYTAIAVTNPLRFYYPVFKEIADPVGGTLSAVAPAATTAPAPAVAATAISTEAVAKVAGVAPVAATPIASPPIVAPPVTAIPVTTPPAVAVPPGTIVAPAPVASLNVSPVLFQLASTTNAAAAVSTQATRKALISYVGDRSLTGGAADFVAASTDQQGAEISGNVVEVAPSVRTLVIADVVGSCILRGNRVALATAASSTSPTRPPGTANVTAPVYAYASALIASDNYVNAYSTVASMTLWATKATILGNVTTTQITFEGSALGAPWNALNGG